MIRAGLGPRCQRGPLALMMCAALALTGCAGYYYGEDYGPTLGSLTSPHKGLLDSSYRAADTLLQAAPWMAGLPVRVAALVDADAPAAPSRFGRLLAEQIAGRLVQKGVPVVGSALRPVATAEPLLQTMPSPAPLSPLQPLQPIVVSDAPRMDPPLPIVVGSYTVSAQRVFVSLKLLRSDGTPAIAAYDYALPLDKDVRSLLRAP